ncbi:MAG: phosphoglycerate dehydrogenase [Bdellovibrionales bacterium]|nr:phosphoglycerate dehydrogenase [Bdellovibrionales bacterium]
MQQKFSNIKFNDDGLKLEGNSLVEFLRGCEGAIVALEPINNDVLAGLSDNLKIISKYGVGLNNIDQQAMEKYRIVLGWRGGVNRRAVSELALGMILDLFRKISLHNSELKAGRWNMLRGVQLTEKTVGIIGLGNIGKDLVKLLTPFSCKILGCDITDVSQFAKQHNIEMVSAEEIYKYSDVVSLHVPYTEKTHMMINDTALSHFKKNAVLINLSRGNIVDEASLYKHLSAGTIAGAAMDVFANEPLIESPLFKCDNFVGTPHVGGSSEEGILAMGTSAIDELANYFSKL